MNYSSIVHDAENLIVMQRTSHIIIFCLKVSVECSSMYVLRSLCRWKDFVILLINQHVLIMFAHVDRSVQAPGINK